MKNVIKNISIVVVAIILLSACKKEDIKPTYVTNNKINVDTIDYHGSYYVAKQKDSQGNENTSIGSYSNLSFYQIDKDSFCLGSKNVLTGIVTKSSSVLYTATIVDDSIVNIFVDNKKLCEITKGSDPYDLVLRGFPQSSSGIIWIDNYLKKM